jgi:hypothetical protein
MLSKALVSSLLTLPLVAGSVIAQTKTQNPPVKSVYEGTIVDIGVDGIMLDNGQQYPVMLKTLNKFGLKLGSPVKVTTYEGTKAFRVCTIPQPCCKPKPPAILPPPPALPPVPPSTPIPQRW